MAYAAVISLKHAIQRLINPINLLLNTKLAYAYNELNSFGYMLQRLDASSSRSFDRSVINAKIREAVWKLEDALESYVLLYHSLPPSQGHGYKVDEIEIEIDSFLKTVKMLREEYYKELENALPGEEDDAAVSPIDDDFGGSKSTTVGLSDQSEEIINELLHGTPELKTVSLVGMAGIGKTLFAIQIYQHPLIAQHFDSRLWVSLGPKDQIDNIFVDIAAQIERGPRDLFKERDAVTLRYILRNSLRGGRYLIVLDDKWTTQVLNYFPLWLPNYENGSRFLVTTRLQEVAEYRRAKIHQMPFLNNEESWNLLWQNVFAEKSFPSELEKQGRKIAENCEGLPLLILAVANILCGLDKTEEYWKKVAEKKPTTFTDAYDQIYEVLLSSYEYLPQHLKACFLYKGVFPQSCEIPLSKIINLWAVEDFLEPSLFQNLENFGTECLQDLVSKSLAIACKRSFERVKRIKSSKLHSAFWYLCVTEARKSFLWFV